MMNQSWLKGRGFRAGFHILVASNAMAVFVGGHITVSIQCLAWPAFDRETPHPLAEPRVVRVRAHCGFVSLTSEGGF